MDKRLEEIRKEARALEYDEKNKSKLRRLIDESIKICIQQKQTKLATYFTESLNSLDRLKRGASKKEKEQTFDAIKNKFILDFSVNPL